MDMFYNQIPSAMWGTPLIYYRPVVHVLDRKERPGELTLTIQTSFSCMWTSRFHVYLKLLSKAYYWGMISDQCGFDLTTQYLVHFSQRLQLIHPTHLVMSDAVPFRLTNNFFSKYSNFWVSSLPSSSWRTSLLFLVLTVSPELCVLLSLWVKTCSLFSLRRSGDFLYFPPTTEVRFITGK